MSSASPHDRKKQEPPCSSPSEIIDSSDEVPVVRVHPEPSGDPPDHAVDAGSRIVTKLRQTTTKSEHSSSTICSGVLVATTLGAGIQYPSDNHSERDDTEAGQESAAGDGNEPAS